MYFIYIIKSIKFEKWYIGSTDNVEKRLGEHNRGKTQSIRAYIPYQLLYVEKFDTRTEARKREIQIKKSGIIRKQLKENITREALSSNG